MRQPDRHSRPKRPSSRPAPKVRPRRKGIARVELISVGRELLRGRIADSNAQNLARRMTQRGHVVQRIVAVDDSKRSVSEALREALGRNPNLVVLTGGLGPSDEDRTLAGVADALTQPLTLDHAAKKMVESAYQRLRKHKFVRDGGLNPAREKLCLIPVGSQPVANTVGTSPGVLVHLPGGADVLCLPGMPDEMQAVLDAALPLLKTAPSSIPVALREVESPTADESSLAPLLDRLADEFPGVWINSRPAGSRGRGARILIRFEATGETQEEADATVDGVVKRMLALAAGSP